MLQRCQHHLVKQLVPSHGQCLHLHQQPLGLQIQRHRQLFFQQSAEALQRTYSIHFHLNFIFYSAEQGSQAFKSAFILFFFFLFSLGSFIGARAAAAADAAAEAAAPEVGSALRRVRQQTRNLQCPLHCGLLVRLDVAWCLRL